MKMKFILSSYSGDEGSGFRKKAIAGTESPPAAIVHAGGWRELWRLPSLIA
jgi:hypothetical protein